MINGKKILNTILILIICSSTTTIVHASSDYVLPYPSYMPGNKLYTIHLILETFSKYWHFGDFGQFSYNLRESDKYLVETKTLFEYQQYLLGYKALNKSNDFFIKVEPSLIKAKQNGKDITEKKNTLEQASKKHIEVLQRIIS